METTHADAYTHAYIHTHARTHARTHLYVSPLSPSQQSRVYDRRTSGERLQKAVALTGQATLHSLGVWVEVVVVVGEEEEEEEEEKEEADREDRPARGSKRTTCTYEKGDVIAVVERASTEKKPRILLGKVLKLDWARREVLLAWLKPVSSHHGKDGVGAHFYKLVVGDNTWVESMAAVVHPIDIQPSKRPGVYRLLSSLEDIHRAVKKK